MKNELQAVLTVGLIGDISALMQNDFVIADKGLYEILESRLNTLEKAYAEATGFEIGSEEDKAYRAAHLTAQCLARAAAITSNERTQASIQAILNEANFNG